MAHHKMINFHSQSVRLLLLPRLSRKINILSITNNKNNNDVYVVEERERERVFKTPL